MNGDKSAGVIAFSFVALLTLLGAWIYAKSTGKPFRDCLLIVAALLIPEVAFFAYWYLS